MCSVYSSSIPGIFSSSAVSLPLLSALMLRVPEVSVAMGSGAMLLAQPDHGIWWVWILLSFRSESGKLFPSRNPLN